MSRRLQAALFKEVQPLFPESAQCRVGAPPDAKMQTRTWGSPGVMGEPQPTKPVNNAFCRARTDKLTILRIKVERIGDPAKLAHVQDELAVLERAWQEAVPESEAVVGLRAELIAVNESLWEAEEGVRKCEVEGDSGERFVEVARSIPRFNDERAAIKRRVNDLLGAIWQEQKSYR